MDYEALKKMTVTQLRDEAAKYPDVQSASGMKKEQLIDLLAHKMGIEKPAPRPKAAGDKGALGKAALKTKIVELKKARLQAREAKDRKKVSQLRRRIHRLKRRVGKAS